MAEDVTQQIDQLRRRLQWRRAFVASCWFVAVVVMGVFTLSTIDWLLGVADVVGRVIGTLALGAIVVLSGHRWLTKVWRKRFTSVSVAHRIERQYPELRDIVTSALHFNQQSPSVVGAGSETLRRAVVLRATASVRDIDYQQLVSPRTLGRAILMTLALLLMIAGLMWQAPRVVSTGFTRLLNPMSSAKWPRVSDLQIINPTQILALGEDLVIQLRDTHGSLPTSVDVQSRFRHNGRWEAGSQTFATTGASQELRLANIQESLEYRATGGDHHSMRWHQLKVVTPPRMAEVRVTVFPPAYTGLSREQLESGESLLAGSRLQVEGRLDEPVTSVVLRGETGFTISAVLEKDGKTFCTQEDEWQIESSDVISFEIMTTEGLKTRARRQLTLNVVTDRPPRVAFLEPERKLTVTPTAVVPMVVHAQDDMAIQNIQLIYRRTDRLQEGDQRLSIFEDSGHAPTSPGAQHQQVEFLWHLETLGLKLGSIVEVNAEASDYRTATARTDFPRRLFVVSKDELLNEIVEQETSLLEILLRLKRKQSALHDKTTQWATQAWDSQRLNKEIADLLSEQRQLSQALANNHDSVIHRLEGIVDDYDRNGLSRPESRERLAALHRELIAIVQKPLPAIEQLLRNWLRDNELSIDQLKPQEITANVIQQQNDVIEMLQQAINFLTIENTLARYENEIAALQATQQRLAEWTRKKVQDEAQSSIEENKRRLWPDAGKNQHRLSRDLAKLVMRMSRSANQPSAIAGKLSSTASLARNLGVQTTMQTAADDLGYRRFDQALSLQKQALADLQKIRGSLTNETSGRKGRAEINPGGNRTDEEGSPSGKNEPSDGNSAAGSSPTESREPAGRNQEAPAEEAKIAEDLIQDIWGHLPDRQREQILQPLREEFLPEYAPEIEAYFHALAKPEEVPGR